MSNSNPLLIKTYMQMLLNHLEKGGESSKASSKDMELQKRKEEGFNPDQFRTQTGEDTQLKPLGKKKSLLGSAKS